MAKLFSLLFLLLSTLCAKEFTVASYNVENLFDLKHDKSEYKEYIPHTKSNWNKKNYQIKLNHTAKVIKDINADIIALQEVESEGVLKALLKKLPNYSNYTFVKNKKSAVGLAVISQYKIKKTQAIKFKSKVNRPIQVVHFLIEKRPFVVVNNHWPSKRQKESQRVLFGLKLKEYLHTLPKDMDYILAGDFNSNYNEYETIKQEKRLNDTQSKTAINHLLNTIKDDQFIRPNNIFKEPMSHYNPWLELPFNERFSNIFRGRNNTPDNILLSPALFDQRYLSYVPKSFQVFKPRYLYENRKIKRWKMNSKRVHQGRGYSDHLPVLATFSTKTYKKQTTKNIQNINDLYTIQHLQKPIILNNVTVIYKANSHAIIKTPNSRGIFLYNCAKNLKEGFVYDLKIEKIKEHYGLKEITTITIEEEKTFNSNYQSMLQNSKGFDLNKFTHQNEVITQLDGVYKKGFLYYGNQKIRVYAKDKSVLPKNGQNITIISGHLGYYKQRTQIIIHKRSDISVN